MVSVLKIQSWLHRYVVSKVLMVLTVLPGRFSITCGKDAGHLMGLGAGMLLGLRRYLEPMNSWNFTILCSALLCTLPFIKHLSFKQPPLPPAPLWWVEHCPHAAPK